MTLRRAATVLVCLAIAGCDVVTDRYDTVAEARADRLFERGWLPDILPASAVKIRVSNDLDLNISEGEFAFASGDFSTFRGQLSAGAPSRAPFKDWPAFVQNKVKEGYVSAAFAREGSTWVFVCHEKKGHCVYRMWPNRAG
jgi:hypothetical protein